MHPIRTCASSISIYTALSVLTRFSLATLVQVPHEHHVRALPLSEHKGLLYVFLFRLFYLTIKLEHTFRARLHCLLGYHSIRL